LQQILVGLLGEAQLKTRWQAQGALSADLSLAATLGNGVLSVVGRLQTRRFARGESQAPYGAGVLPCLQAVALNWKNLMPSSLHLVVSNCRPARH